MRGNSAHTMGYFADFNGEHIWAGTQNCSWPPPAGDGFGSSALDGVLPVILIWDLDSFNHQITQGIILFLEM